MKKQAFSLLLCLAVCLSMTSCFGKGKEEESSGSDTDKISSGVQTEDTDAVSSADTDVSIETEKETPKVTETDPVTETEQIKETSADTEKQTTADTTTAAEDTTEKTTTIGSTTTEPAPATTVSYDASGSFVSTEAPRIELVLDYSYTPAADGSYQLSLAVSVSCYELYAGEKVDSGTLKIGNELVTFSTAPIDHPSNTKTSIQLFTYETVIPAGSTQVEIGALWDFRGYYHDTSIPTLSASGILMLPGNHSSGEETTPVTEPVPGTETEAAPVTETEVVTEVVTEAVTETQTEVSSAAETETPVDSTVPETEAAATENGN